MDLVRLVPPGGGPPGPISPGGGPIGPWSWSHSGSLEEVRLVRPMSPGGGPIGPILVPCPGGGPPGPMSPGGGPIGSQVTWRRSHWSVGSWSTSHITWRRSIWSHVTWRRSHLVPAFWSLLEEVPLVHQVLVPYHLEEVPSGPPAISPGGGPPSPGGGPSGPMPWSHISHWSWFPCIRHVLLHQMLLRLENHRKVGIHP